MGTTYKIECYAPMWVSKLKVIQEINTTFDSIVSTFSTWSENSEISLLNKNQSTDPIIISSQLAQMLKLSNELYNLSAGAFDPTVKPLIDLWGFNNKNAYFIIPSEINTIKASEFVGMDKLLIEDLTLTKVDPRIILDLSSIAKGHAVDKLSEKLTKLGIKEFMVEVGGEVLVAMPESKKKSFWKLGIVTDYNYSQQELFLKPFTKLR